MIVTSMKYFIALSVFVSLQYTYAGDFSLDSGQDLFEKCRAAERIIDNEKNITVSDSRKGGACTSYIKGFGDGSEMTSLINSINLEKNSNYKKYKKYKLYCSKNNTTIGDIVHAIVAHIRINPKLRKEKAQIAIASTLKKYYSCK